MKIISTFAIVALLASATAAYAACPQGYYNCGGNLCCPR